MRRSCATRPHLGDADPARTVFVLLLGERGPGKGCIAQPPPSTFKNLLAPRIPADDRRCPLTSLPRHTAACDRAEVRKRPSAQHGTEHVVLLARFRFNCATTTLTRPRAVPSEKLAAAVLGRNTSSRNEHYRTISAMTQPLNKSSRAKSWLPPCVSSRASARRRRPDTRAG